MTVKVHATNPTAEQARMRENILGAIDECIAVAQEMMELHPDVALRERYEHGLKALLSLQELLFKEKERFNISILQFFKSPHARHHLKFDGVEFISVFADRPLSVVKMYCDRAYEPLPPLLELFYTNYNARRGKMPVGRATRPVDPLFGMFTNSLPKEEANAAQGKT